MPLSRGNDYHGGYHMSMSVNGIGNEPINVDAAYTKSPSASAAKPAASTTTTPAKTQTEDKAVVYEPSAKKPVADKNTYTQNTALVNKLKADAEQKNESFRKLVESVISKQGSTYQNADSMWKFLASGKFTVDKETALAAQKEIGEDGYWGVKQTSERIFSFAEALTGGDPDKMEEMRAAFIKGYKQATGTWGKDLPDISSKTYDAVIEKFDNYNKKDEQDSVTKIETEA